MAAACGQIGLNVKMAWTDYKRTKCLTCIAILAITIAVSLTMIAQGLLTKVSIVFYNSVAATNGEMDMLIRPNGGQYINGTMATQLLAGVTDLPPTFRSTANGFMSTDLGKLNSGIPVEDVDNLKVYYFFLDIEKENEIGLGYRDKLLPLNPGEAYVSKRIATVLQLKDGDTINARVNTIDTFDKVRRRFSGLNPGVTTTPLNLYSIAQLKVKIFNENLVGRFPEDPNLLYGVIIENDHVMKSFAPGFVAATNPQLLNFMQSATLNEYSTVCIVQFKDRLDLYLSGDYNAVLRQAVTLGSLVMQKLAVFDLDLSMPLVSNLSFTRFANAALSLTFNLILGGILLMAAYVINNIMNMNIHSKVYSTAIQRTVGLTRTQLFGQVFTFSLGYSLFGIAIAVPLVSIIFWYLNTRLLPSINAGFEIEAEGRNTGISLAIGLAIPLLSALIPMVNLMMNNIAWSLDKEHSKTSSLKVYVENKEEAFPWTMVIVALFSAGFGIFIQIFLPLSLASLNISLFIIVFFVLLISLLVGLLLIMLNFSYIIEMGVLFITRLVFFCERRFIHLLTEMNLVSHRVRNRKTVLIYSLSLAFINFLNVSLLMQTESSQTTTLRRRGGPFALRFGMTGTEWVDLQKTIGMQQDYTWTGVSKSLIEYKQRLGISQIQTTNQGGILTTLKTEYFAVSPNYMNYTASGLTTVATSGFSNTSLSPTEQLYTRFNQNGAIISESLRANVLMDCSDRTDTITMKLVSTTSNYLSKEFSCASSMTRFPAFIMGDRITLLITEAAISYESLFSLFDNVEIPFNKIVNYTHILLKMNPGKDAQALKSAFQAYEYLYKYSTFYYPDFVARFQSTTDILNIVFSALTIIAMCLSLFSLISTVAANIVEQSKELAILRCLGLNRFAIARVFLYESIVVVLTGGFIGLIVGSAIGWTMASQNALFSNSVPNIAFPWSVFITLVIFSAVSSFVAAFIPTYRYLAQNIVKLIKGM